MSPLILIPVPGTDSRREPVVRVVVVPRLDAAATVADAGLGDWPAKLDEARFQVVLDDGPPLDVEPVHQGNVGTWNAFFGTLRVDAASPPRIGEVPTVRETSAEVAAVGATYRETAASFDPNSGRQPAVGATAAKELRTRWSSRVPPAQLRRAAEPAPVIDFHRVFDMLREHPTVMRRLGLVFDLPLPGGAGLADEGTLRVLWADPPRDVPRPVSPPAAYEMEDRDGERRLVAGRTALARRGLVDLGDDAAWTTATIDVDNAVPRLQDAAASVGSAPPPEAGDEADADVRLPALHSAGILLIRRGRAADFANRRAAVTRNASLTSLEDAEPLTAEDLMLGLRVDVRPKGASRWTSLVRREALYTVDGKEIAPRGEEEGHVKLGAAVRQGDGALLADEIVARWHGWSLAVPAARSGAPRRDRRRDLPFDFGWEFEVPDASLLPLRFGNDYELRARIADIAGGGVGPDDPEASMATPAIPYARHDPVRSPNVLVPEGLEDLGPGGGVDLLVIRSDAPDYPRNDERFVSAPVTTLEVCEQHGVLDGSDEQTLERVRRGLNGGLPDPASAGLTVFLVPEPGGLSARLQPVAWPGDWPDALGMRLVLVARTRDDEPVIDADAGTGVVNVQLAPAEQATLQLSSFLRDGFADHFAMFQGQSVPMSMQAVKDGRHPMVTPPRKITFVHAVRRPLTDPSGTFTPIQEPGATSALLAPEPPLLNVHAGSTQQLQIAAAWDEYDDDAVTSMTGFAVQNVPVGRADEVLREQVVHELGDTRHRVVRYTLTAVSRFRHLYEAGEDAKRFVAQTETAPVSIKSTARPAPPAVRAVVPAFRWTSEENGSVIRRVRSGGTLRVELLRPWHLTGEGEQLAVVVNLTEATRDPIWSTTEVERNPPVSAFVPTSGEATSLPDGTPVTVVAYDAELTHDWWAADVELPGLAASSYRPFVRLAVARYQRESLAGLELSAVVQTELVQLLPERTLTIDTAGPALAVQLDGVGPGGPNVNRVDVIAETRTGASAIDVSALGPADGIDAWTATEIRSGKLGERIEVARPTAAAGTFRVRIREVELLAAPGAPPAAQTGSPEELTERVVFTDVVPIP